MRAKYAAWRVMPNGQRRSIRPGGRRLFGRATLAWVKRRAKKRHHKIIVKKVTTKHSRFKLFMRWGLTHEPSIHYLQRRPFNVLMFKLRKLPIFDDCSATLTMLARAAGFKDPNGRGYNGTGFTGTLRANSPQCRLDQRPDFIVYGAGNGAHVCATWDHHTTDPIMWSHGSESGPKLYRHSTEVAVHGAYFTCHHFA